MSFLCMIFRGKGVLQKRVAALRDLRRLLSKAECPPIGTALKAGAIPLLAQCLSFGSPDEQVWVLYTFTFLRVSRKLNPFANQIFLFRLQSP